MQRALCLGPCIELKAGYFARLVLRGIRRGFHVSLGAAVAAQQTMSAPEPFPAGVHTLQRVWVVHEPRDSGIVGTNEVLVHCRKIERTIVHLLDEVGRQIKTREINECGKGAILDHAQLV